MITNNNSTVAYYGNLKLPSLELNCFVVKLDNLNPPPHIMRSVHLYNSKAIFLSGINDICFWSLHLLLLRKDSPDSFCFLSGKNSFFSFCFLVWNRRTLHQYIVIEGNAKDGEIKHQ